MCESEVPYLNWHIVGRKASKSASPIAHKKDLLVLVGVGALRKLIAGTGKRRRWGAGVRWG